MRHRIVGPLGKGAMGEVFTARDDDLGRKVALKRLSPKHAGHDMVVKRFLAEVRITAQLDHPAIIPVYALERDEDGAPSYAMKLVRGRTLEAFLHEARDQLDAGSVDAEHALPARLELFLQVCAAVHYAHTRGVVHRDLKPANVMVGPHHEVLVMDWGVARKVDGADPEDAVELPEDDVAETMLGAAVGTPSFMSPEQASGRRDVDGRSDQYALGLVLHEIVGLRRANASSKTSSASAGSKASTGKGTGTAIERAKRGEREPLTSYSARERVPAELVAIVARATALHPEDRYADVEALADDVRRYLRDEPIAALPDTPRRRALRWISRHREATLAGVVGLVGLVFAVGAAATMAGLGALEAHRWAAQRHEEQLSRALDAASGQARRIDAEFEGDEALLEGVAGAAVYALGASPPDVPVYLPPAYAAGSVPGLAASAVYHRPVSVDVPDGVVAPDVAPETADRELKQLATLAATFRRALVASAGYDALADADDRQRARIADEGVPMVWAYAATEEGVLVGLPGAGDYPEAYDPRAMPWYRNGAGRAPTWGPAEEDESGMGLLVSCSIGLWSPGGRHLGVAAVDISLAHITRDLLVLPGFPASEGWLVDGGRRVVVSSRTQERGAREAFPFPEVLDAVAAGRPSGHLEQPGGDARLLVWAPLEALGWTYVVTLPAGDLR